MKRRALFGGAAAVGAAAVGGAALGATATGATSDPEPTGTRSVPFHGRHQAGIEMEPQAHQSLLALDLRDGVDAAAVRRLLILLTDDARRLTAGRAPLADLEPELAAVPARLTVTFGFGPGLVAVVRGAARVPTWLRPLPKYRTIDRLEDRWSGGDLLLQVAADDPTTIAHALRLLVRDARAFATVRWRQDGFRHAAGTHRPGTAMRNLFGQVDGTANESPGSAEFDRVVWRDGPEPWLAGGTTLVVRRIAMNLDTWDEVGREGREFSIGRRLADGAPTTGGRPSDDVDLEAVDERGFTVVGPSAHVRRAREGDDGERIFRRGYNYDDATGTGLIFCSFQADLERQYLPIQARLAEQDALNAWTTPIGSAVFAIPAGIRPDGFVGEALFT
ncbi:Dyp-type peroxidase [Aeromicrobium duanguangcaii]|uniref:Dyp-type peroxidase n=1 Tax=Aeromicrobium duanguangcaii TaxID=2968086 RepID=A0ABY5KG00_9ACTN|nr:Dyp-type peroxidase [Aeromicrobium duanguangcaii]MCD9154645.1 Dyp-type peroxidase [Aeromicrobium duanguangcaii]MCL3838767.1 Dyp-type peroxidase [Aeromicrobium duanguangcaii]UUI67941.1 Dyp-type peroxidase [Aeromicrobium duanguangcaii]